MSDYKKKFNLIDTISNENFFNEYELKNSTAYLGIDPTAIGVHIGHLIPIQLALDLIKEGCKIIILIGGFTAHIGDPTDKNEERVKLSNDSVVDFSSGILYDLKEIFSIYKDKVIFVNNKDWLSSMTMYDYITKYGFNISVNKKISMHTFKKRLNDCKNLSMSEFFYPDLQSIDFYHLYKTYGCNIQIGGGDQWGNIAAGVSFVEKMTKANNILGIATSLITDQGKKISKSEGTPPFLKLPNNIYSFILNISDELSVVLASYFKVQLIGNDPIENKKILIKKILEIYYHDKANDLFEKIDLNNRKKFNESIDLVEESDLIKVNNERLSKILVELGVVKSCSEAKRKILEKAVLINDIEILQDFNVDLKKFKLSFGKKNHFFILIN